MNARRPGGQGTPEARIAVLLAGTIAAVSAVLVLCFRFPPAWDASHHIATPWVMARILAGDPFFTQHFALHVVPLPYWLTTLAVGALMPLAGPYHAFAIVTALYVLALPWSFHRLQRALGVEQPELLPLVALLAFCQPFWAGLTNFVFGLPLLLLALAAWARLDPMHPGRRLAAFAGWLALLYLAHIYLVAALFGLLVLWTLPAFLGRRPDFGGLPVITPARLAALALTAAVFALGVYMVLIHPGENANSGPLVWALTPLRVPAMLARAFGSPTLQHPWFLLAVLPAGLGALAAVARHRMAAFESPRPAMLAGSLALAAIALLAPANMEDGLGHTVEDIAQRFELPAVLIALIALPRPDGRFLRMLVLAGALVYAPIKLADVLSWYRLQDRQMTAFVERIAPAVRENGLVLAITSPDASTLDWRHRLMNYAGNYLLIERRAYVSSLFAARGQQPLSHRLTGQHRLILDWRVTDDEWRRFDYLLVQTDREHPVIPGLDTHTRERAFTGQFRLYEIVR